MALVPSGLGQLSKYKAALSAAYAAGLRVSEVVALKVSDIDSERLLLRIEQGKGRKDRVAMLAVGAAARLVSLLSWTGEQPPQLRCRLLE
jgi:site-specific recombinase XerD